MDKASKALAQGLPTGKPRSDRAVADHGGIPWSTLCYRAHGRQSIEAKAQSQQYLALLEEKAVVEFILQTADLGTPVRIKHIPSIAFTAACHRPEAHRPVKPPDKNWAKAFERRHPKVEARKVKALDWNRRERNIYHKIEDRFDVIGKVLNKPAMLHENVHKMDETGVMLSMLGSVKVLVSRQDLQDYRGACVKRTLVTAIECISADGRYLKPMVIWPPTTHRSHWTTHPKLDGTTRSLSLATQIPRSAPHGLRACLSRRPGNVQTGGRACRSATASAHTRRSRSSSIALLIIFISATCSPNQYEAAIPAPRVLDPSRK